MQSNFDGNEKKKQAGGWWKAKQGASSKVNDIENNMMKQLKMKLKWGNAGRSILYIYMIIIIKYHIMK